MNREQFIHRDYRYLLGDLAAEIANLTYILEGKVNILFVPFQSSVIANDDAFLTLWDNGNKTAALSFIRIISEHLVYLYAEYLYPNKVISKVYGSYKELDDIRVKGEKLKPKEIREQIAADYKGFSQIWKHYHYFIHPSYLQGTGISLDGATEKGISDMVKLNNWILDILTKIKGRYKSKVKEEGKYQQYLEQIKKPV